MAEAGSVSYGRSRLGLDWQASTQDDLGLFLCQEKMTTRNERMTSS